MWTDVVSWFSGLEVIKFIVAPLAVVILLYLRAGSIYGPLDRLARLIMGNADVQNPQLKQYLSERRDVEMFNFVNGLRAENMPDVQRYLDWYTKTGISLVCLKRAGTWFDRTSLQLKKVPHKWRQVMPTVAVIGALMFCAYAVIVIAMQPEVLAKMRDSGTVFWYSEKEARSFWSEEWRLQKTNCEASPTKVPGTKLKEHEVAALCALLKHSDVATKVSAERSSQRAASVWLLGMLGIIGMTPSLLLMSMLAAIRISKIPKDEQAQLQLTLL